MAEINVNKKHIIERIGERCGMNDSQAGALLTAVVAAVKTQAPDDWRFTTNPHGRFFIACGDRLNCRLLGRTGRDRNGIGKDLLRRLKAKTITYEELGVIKQDYVALLREPNCHIIHELKTCLGPNQGMTEAKELFDVMRSSLSHVVLVDERMVASRPNALLIEDGLWVRQAEHFDLSVPNDSYREDLLFVRLTRDGPDWSKAKSYSIDRQGNLKLRKDVTGEAISRVKPACEPGQRSQSYWFLPTRVDMRKMDLDYGQRKWQGDGDSDGLRPDEALLSARIEGLYRLVRPYDCRKGKGRR